jgi:hypothetical protein
MQQLLTLDIIEQDFINWRKTRRSRSAPIPEELWNKVVAVSGQYKSSKICKRLKLSGAQFKNRITGHLQLPSPESMAFVTATPPVSTSSTTPISTVPTPTISPVTLSLSRSKRKLELSVALADLNCVLPQMAKLL